MCGSFRPRLSYVAPSDVIGPENGKYGNKTVIMVASGCLFLRIFAIGDKDSIEKRPAPQNMDNNTNC